MGLIHKEGRCGVLLFVLGLVCRSKRTIHEVTRRYTNKILPLRGSFWLDAEIFRTRALRRVPKTIDEHVAVLGLLLADHAAQLSAQAFNLGQLLFDTLEQGSLSLDTFID